MRSSCKTLIVTVAAFIGAVCLARASSGVNLVGRVVDDATGLPIAGAVVVVAEGNAANQPIYTSAPPLGSAPIAITDSGGSFTVRDVQQPTYAHRQWSWSWTGLRFSSEYNVEWVQIFPRNGDPHVVYNGLWPLSPTAAWPLSETVSVGTIELDTPTDAERAWLAQVNYDRSNIAFPRVNRPLAFEEIHLLAARYRASLHTMDHGCPRIGARCMTAWEFMIAHHGMPTSENLAFEPSWFDAERAWIAENGLCAQGWNRCTYTEATGHCINIMNGQDWIGVGGSGMYFVESLD